MGIGEFPTSLTGIKGLGARLVIVGVHGKGPSHNSRGRKSTHAPHFGCSRAKSERLLRK